MRHSIDRFGDLSGITFNTRTQELVTGHQRVQQLRKQYGDDLKIEPLSDDRAVIRTPAGEFAVRFVDWSAAKQAAANVAANSAKLQGTFDDTLNEYLLTIAGDVQKEMPGAFDDLYLAELILLEDGPKGGGDEDREVTREVVVACESEEQQLEVYNLLTDHGYEKVRVLTQ